jgi:hypothetical protein
MNRTSLLLPALLLSVFVRAQFLILPHDSLVDLPAERMQRITASAWADYNSSALYNELTGRIYRGGYISRELRQRSRDLLQDNNRAGYDAGVRLTWTGNDSLFGRPRMRPLLSAAWRNTMGARFTRDVFELGFFGNAQFEDRTATLSPSAHAQMTWQTLGFGIQDVVTRSFLRVDLVRGRAFNASDIHRATLYTAPDGRALVLDMDAVYWRTDTAGRQERHTNGLGASISGQWNVGLPVAGLPAVLSLSVEDLGFVAWNKNSIRLERDTGFIYEGLQVENIFDLDNVITGEEQLLDTLGLRFRHGPYSTLLPFRAMLGMDLQLSDRWHSRLSVEHRYLPGYIPQVMLSASRRLGNRALLGASAAYGGFGVLRFGLAARVRFGEHVLVEAGSSHVPGLIIGATRGVGAFLSVSTAF